THSALDRDLYLGGTAPDVLSAAFDSPAARLAEDSGFAEHQLGQLHAAEPLVYEGLVALRRSGERPQSLDQIFEQRMIGSAGESADEIVQASRHLFPSEMVVHHPDHPGAFVVNHGFFRRPLAARA